MVKSNKGITFHRAMFGKRIREIRASKKISAQQVGQKSEYCPQSIRQIEKGKQMPNKRRSVETLFDALDLHGKERQTMLECWSKATKKEWTDAHGDAIEQGGVNLYFQYERHADHLFLWCDKIIHGLFHHEEYTRHARDMFAFYEEAHGNDAILRLQQERRERFWMQFADSPAKTTSLLLGPSVFHILEQMPKLTYTSQIEHLLRMNERPGVDIRYTGYINTLANINNFSLLEISEPDISFLHVEYLRTNSQPQDHDILQMHKHYYAKNFADASSITNYPINKE